MMDLSDQWKQGRRHRREAAPALRDLLAPMGAFGFRGHPERRVPAILRAWAAEGATVAAAAAEAGEPALGERPFGGRARSAADDTRPVPASWADLGECWSGGRRETIWDAVAAAS
ncbi:hypothetical protein ABZ723_25070 [Streptomyces sp. NPDC006700]|uniref:hypothetical protein n=1 Tax=unclassified Streptomyces TaxID=2593676 RepID=UPI0033F249F6